MNEKTLFYKGSGEDSRSFYIWPSLVGEAGWGVWGGKNKRVTVFDAAAIFNLEVVKF